MWHVAQVLTPPPGKLSPLGNCHPSPIHKSPYHYPAPTTVLTDLSVDRFPGGGWVAVIGKLDNTPATGSYVWAGSFDPWGFGGGGSAIAHPPAPKAQQSKNGHFQSGKIGWVRRHRGPKPTPMEGGVPTMGTPQQHQPLPRGWPKGACHQPTPSREESVEV